MTSLPPFLASEFEPAAMAQAAWHVIPVPYEKTVSYGGGTAQGPAAILQASQQLEAYLEGMGTPGDRGIHTTRPAAAGGGTAEEALHEIRDAVDTALRSNAIPVLLGGEHTVTYGAVSALAAKGKRFGIVQFDAHADLRTAYSGTVWSHACVIRRIVEDLSLPVCQLGIRSICQEELTARKTFGVHALDASAIARHGIPGRILPENFPRDIYITFDVDALDASLMPATGTPEPGGLSWWDTVRLLENICADRTVVGLDVVELAPQANLHHCNYTAAKLTYLLMGLCRPPVAGG